MFLLIILRNIPAHAVSIKIFFDMKCLQKYLMVIFTGTKSCKFVRFEFLSINLQSTLQIWCFQSFTRRKKKFYHTVAFLHASSSNCQSSFESELVDWKYNSNRQTVFACVIVEIGDNTSIPTKSTDNVQKMQS